MLTEEAAAVRMMLELGIDPQEVAEMVMDARRRSAESRDSDLPKEDR